VVYDLRAPLQYFQIMKLFGLYNLDDIPNLKGNHAQFAELNCWEYRAFSIRNVYEKWALVYRLLESHPGETLAFIDAFSYFVSPSCSLDTMEPILIQEAQGKIMDNFFVVQSTTETRRVFHNILRDAQSTFAGGSFLFEPRLPDGIAKPYGHRTADGLHFNADPVFTFHGRYLSAAEIPQGFTVDVALSQLADDSPGRSLVLRYGGTGWDAQFWTTAEILCQKREAIQPAASEPCFEVVNPGHPKALLSLSCSEPGMPPAEYAAVSERNFRQYAERQNVTLYLYKAIPEELKGLHSTWTKPYLVLRHLPKHEYLSWVDADLLISRNFPLPEGEDVIVYNDPGAWLFNAGFMTFRNSAKTMEFLQAVITRCESIDDRSSLYVNGSDQTQFIEEFRLHFPDSLPRSNLVANIPVIFSSFREPGPGLWHFMGLNPPSVRALVMDYYDKNIVNGYHANSPHTSAAAGGNARMAQQAGPGKVLKTEEIPAIFGSDRSAGNAIAFCADRKFFPYASVAILSLLENGGCEDIPIFFFADHFEKEDIENFDRLCSSAPGRLHLVELNHENLKGLPSVRHMSRATFIRLWVPEILRSFGKILYLDSDILVVSELSSVFETELQGKCVAAVRDLVGEKTCKIHFFRSGHKAYFNAGVLLIDTAQWRHTQISEKVLKLARNDDEREKLSAYADPCLLNFIIRGDFVELDKTFNWLTFEPKGCSAGLLELAPTPTPENLREAKILHFVGGGKPWMPSSTLGKIWLVYEAVAQRSPWYKSVMATKSPADAVRPSATRNSMKVLRTQKTLPSRRWDYVSPNFVRVFPDEAFPQMVIGDVNGCGWPYLRREIPHNWYIDRRTSYIGFATRDEASILFNTALEFVGKRCLEIGCWMGWSAAHILMAGTELDIIDPLFANPVNAESVRSSLAWAAKRSPSSAKAFTYAGFSPAKLAELAAAEGRKWDFAFIDGDHEGDGPLRDAQECEKHLRDDSVVLFHDLSSPFVAKGLDHFRDRGWNTKIYNTMQIMGVAWRGNVSPVDHQPDPQVQWEIPEHLDGYEVSDRSFDAETAEFERLCRVIKPFTMVDRARLLSLYRNALRICRENIPGDFVECGACRGGSAALMAYVAKAHSTVPRKVYACDTFEGMPEPGDADRHRGVTAAQCGFPAGSLRAPVETGLSEVARRAGVADTVVPVKGLFRDTLPTLAAKIGPVSLLHADGDWYESTMDIFCNLFEKVPLGGYVQIDDYGHWDGCRKAVEDYQKAKNMRFALEQIDYTGFGFRKA